MSSLDPPLTFPLPSIPSIRAFAPYGDYPSVSPSLEGVGVSIWGCCHRVDLDEKKLSIEWEAFCGSPSGEGSNLLWEGVDAASGDPLDYAAGVYAVDVYLTDASGKPFSYHPATLMGGSRFETKHELHASGRFPTPFDFYASQVFAFAINPATNQSVDITRFSISDSPGGFVVSSNDTKVARRFMYDTDNDSKTVEIEPRALTVMVRYSILTLALTISMFIANWVLTLASLSITFSAMTKGRVTWSAFILHSTMVLVVPSIRNLYLCPPPFGTLLDTAGFFSQIIILTLCSVALLYTLVILPKVETRSSRAQKGS